MQVECPYCSATVDVTGIERHVRLYEGDGHGPHGTVPFDEVDDPWNLRLDFSGAPSGNDRDDDVPAVEYVIDRSRRGRCPSCEEGVLGMKGGGGWFSSGPRRLACPNCGWESPEWIRVRR